MAKRARIEGKNKAGKVVRKVKTFLNDDELTRKKGQGSHEVHLIDTPEYQALVERVYFHLKDGLRSNEIFAMLSVEDESMTEVKFTDLIKYAYAFSENAMMKDREIMFQTHMARYEHIYQKAMSMQGFWHGSTLDKKNSKDIQQIMTKYSQAMAALKGKEELIGLHDKKVVVEFNDHVATVVEKQSMIGREGIPGYTLDNLTLEEQIELLSLIKEARTIPIEGIQRVVIKQRKIEIDINGNRQIVEEIRNIDKVNVAHATYEEMPVSTIGKYKNIEAEEAVIISDPLVKDARPKDLPIPKGALQVQEKIQSGVMDKLKEKLKKDRERKL